MPLYPQAFHITWGTYGVRLPGSEKPHVDRHHNEYGEPLPQPDQNTEEISRDRMKGDPVHLTFEQRKCVEDAIDDVASRYGWTVHAKASQSDHTHVVITAMRDGEELREALKAVATRVLNKQFGKKKWWAEGGRTKYLWERDYFENALDYVKRQGDF